MNKYTPVIGLEVHVELKTKSKMFCGCSTEYFGKGPNTHTCPVCLGLPGALPVPNQKAMEWCVMIGMALNCEIPLVSKFDRKNYFYPDLAKGYQISQYDQPFAQNGYITLSNGKRIGIRRAHMEEDTAKLSHGRGVSLIDFNRGGVPLVEVVTEPDFENAVEVKEYLQKLQQIIRYLGVSDADMEKGEMRLEPNISLREVEKNDPKHYGADYKSAPAEKINNGIATLSQQSGVARNDKNFDLPNYKVEVKNINSFRFVEKAINYEVERQEKILEDGKIPVQETRGWDEKKQKTFSQRVKEEAQDYRYFPEPDIPPLLWTEKQINRLRELLPELPDKKIARLEKEYGLPYYDAEILTREISTADYFEETIKENQGKIEPKKISNWIINKNVNIVQMTPDKLLQTIQSSTQTSQIDEGELSAIIKRVLVENAKAVEDYKKGKKTSIMFLLGQTMRKIGKKVDATVIKEAIEKEL